MGSSTTTNVNVHNDATENVHSNIEHNIRNDNTYNDHTEEGHLYKEDFIAGNYNNLDSTVNSGKQVFHLMNLAVKCEHDDYNCYNFAPTITDQGTGVLHHLSTKDLAWNPDVQDQGKLTVVDADINGSIFGGITVTHDLLIL